MKRIVSQIQAILTPAEARRARVLLALCLPLAIAELAGLLGALPFILVASNPDAMHAHWLVAGVRSVLGTISDEGLLVWLGVMSLVLMLLSVAVRTSHIYLITRFARDAGASLQTRLLARHLQRPLLDIRRNHGAMIQSTIVVEAEGVVEEVVLNCLRIATYVCTASVILGLLVIADPLPGLVMMSLITFGYLLVFGGSRRVLRRLGKGRVGLTRERQRLLSEAVGGQRELQLSQREAAAVARFADTAKTLGALRARMTLIKDIPRGFLEVVIFGSMILLSLWLLGTAGEDASAVLPIIAIYALAAARLFPVLQRLYRAVVAVQAGSAGLDLVRTALAENHTVAAGENAAPKIPLHRDIALDAVGFSYPDAGRIALSGVSLRIPARSVVGFVGESGAGKSTAVDLLLGLISPDRGAVLVDNQPITAANRRGWQQSVGYVPQSIFLTDGTIAENIAFGLRGTEIDRHALDRVIALSGLTRLIRVLPDGVDTCVGERGVRLSGGERQRIGIARALYQDPDLIVFDEATSALDTVTEQAVMREIRAMGAHKTIVIVAHRLSTVRHCDKIFVFESGQIVESGTYDALVGQNRTFRALHEAAR